MLCPCASSIIKPIITIGKVKDILQLHTILCITSVVVNKKRKKNSESGCLSFPVGWIEGRILLSYQIVVFFVNLDF